MSCTFDFGHLMVLVLHYKLGDNSTCMTFYIILFERARWDRERVSKCNQSRGFIRSHVHMYTCIQYTAREHI